MKNILYTIIVSLLFSSAYAGSADGKGVVCDYEFYGAKEDPQYKKYIWFDHGYAYQYKIVGYSIKEIKYPYKEIDTYSITWIEPYPDGSSNRYILTREDLKLYIGGDKPDPCELIEQKQEIFDRLNEIITQVKKKNKI